MDLEAMKAEFLLRGGRVKVAETAPAYGVDALADKARREAAREDRRYEASERRAENAFQRGVEENGYFKS